MFYSIDQNNSGGYFDVDENLCHRLIIEADSEDEVLDKAEELGCYWDGVTKGMDCPCCGDRWYPSADKIDIEKYSTEGWRVGIYDGIYHNTVDEWNKKYGNYEVAKAPEFKKTYSSREYVGMIKLCNIEEYAQFMADEYGWTSPDVRIFYADGTVKEIFSKRVEKLSKK